MCWLFVLTVVTVSTASAQKQCHPVELPICKEAANGTNYKTSVSVKEQLILQHQLQHFNPLIHVNCSQLALIFVCLSHFPFCSSHEDIEPLLPCRSVRDHVYFNCIHLYDSIHLPWPDHLNCNKFPSPPLCIKPPASSSSTSSPTSPPASLTSSSSPPNASSIYFTSPTSSSTPNPSHFTINIKNTPPGPAPAPSDTSFILFIANYVPTFIFSLYIVFLFAINSFVFPLLMILFYYCWLRIRGHSTHRHQQQRNGLTIELKEKLGPLPPVPEQ